jgi:hypothetical protein
MTAIFATPVIELRRQYQRPDERHGGHRVLVSHRIGFGFE